MRATLAGVVRSADRTGPSEREFYASYEWCLNPILSVRELFHRLTEEMDRHEDLGIGWQREECRINMYLFICAIACTVDDYLAWRPWNLSPVVARFPRVRGGAALAQSLLNMPWLMRNLICDRSVVRWRRRWGRCVDRVCDMLVRQDLAPAGDGSDAGPRHELRAMVHALTRIALPERVLRQRMRLPEGFRCQDLTHHDVFAMARRFMGGRRNSEDRLVIVGPRTAGAYLAPLIKAYLSAQGWSRVSWLAVRPKMGVSRREWRQLREAIGTDARVLLVDDYPNTGATFRFLLGVLRRLRVSPQRITILAPRHPAEAEESLRTAVGESDGVTVLRLEPDELYKARVLAGGGAETRIREYYRDWDAVGFQANGQVDAVNTHLWSHYRDRFQVRLKRLFRIQLSRGNETSVVRHLFAKSVGWGWMGYHAYIAGTRLADCVPGVVGLFDGMLLTEWVGDISHPPTGLPGSTRVQALASYVAKRVQRLGLGEDPCFESLGYRWSGWDELIAFLRGPYGRFVGRAKTRVLREHLRRYVTPVPTLVDGQMRPDEWVETPAGIRKVDFEHHNFGGGEMDIVDPAWDLASAIFEFSLSALEQRDLEEAYVRESGDRTISDRLPLYLLLYGVHVMRGATYALARARGGEPTHWNQRYLRARNFVVHHMHRSLAGPARDKQTRWSRRLFFLDLDGVFDCERFGVPHTTPSGIAALELLRSHEFSVVLNTGRDVEQVRDYCEVYGIPGGVAEFGSVFVDAVGESQLPLIDSEAAGQLARVREALKGIPGVFVDDGHRYSVRAYRWRGPRTVALDPGEIHEILTRCRCDSLTVIPRLEDTYLVQNGVSKGVALLAVKKYLGCPDDPASAIGDSDQDLDALDMAELSYAPANCSKALRRLAKRGRCRVMSQPFQKGLLAAVHDVVAHHSFPIRRAPEPVSRGDSHDLLRALSQVAERSRLQRFVAALDRRWL
jgi:hydroxymethylpyrimidine pyrophosphatase-like HAD family hydrolase/orotate phosphoribosyltransferase